MRTVDELQWAHDLLIGLLASDPSFTPDFLPFDLDEVPDRRRWLHQLRRRILFSADAICWVLEHANPCFDDLLKAARVRFEKMGDQFPDNPEAVGEREKARATAVSMVGVYAFWQAVIQRDDVPHRVRDRGDAILRTIAQIVYKDRGGIPASPQEEEAFRYCGLLPVAEPAGKVQ